MKKTHDDNSVYLKKRRRWCPTLRSSVARAVVLCGVWSLCTYSSTTWEIIIWMKTTKPLYKRIRRLVYRAQHSLTDRPTMAGGGTFFFFFFLLFLRQHFRFSNNLSFDYYPIWKWSLSVMKERRISVTNVEPDVSLMFWINQNLALLRN